MTKFRRVKLGRAKHEWQWPREWGEDSEGGILERDAAVRSRIKMAVIALGLTAIISCLAGCYVIVPVVNFGELTIPRGDMGFLNKYEDTYDMRKMEGAASSDGIQSATSTSKSTSSSSEWISNKKNRSPTAGELLFKK